jgi:hypothetical protein
VGARHSLYRYHDGRRPLMERELSTGVLYTSMILIILVVPKKQFGDDQDPVPACTETTPERHSSQTNANRSRAHADIDGAMLDRNSQHTSALRCDLCMVHWLCAAAPTLISITGLQPVPAASRKGFAPPSLGVWQAALHLNRSMQLCITAGLPC